jgi:F-type H+-transporting ATPase subunit gamma
VISHVAHANTEYRHPYLVEREAIKRVGYVIVSTDRGLCGGLNANLFRKLLADVRQYQQQGVEIDVVAIGQKAVQFFRRIKGVNLIGSATHLGERPKVEQLVGVIKVMLDAFGKGTVDHVFLCYNDFVNTMSQTPRVDALLPLPAVAAEMESGPEGDRPQASLSARREFDWDYLYEPEPEVVLDHLMQRYIESLVYQAVLENLASEQAARMVAMKAASDNATKLIGELTLIYNKARQAAITQEISEIVGGAAAV